MTLHITFDRQRGNAFHDGGFDGFGGGFFAVGEDAYFDVLRQMTDAGLPDGPAEAFDERGVRCWLFPSIHRAAWRYRPTEAQKRADAEYRSWFPRKRR